MKDVIVAIIASGAIFGFLQFIIQFLATRNDIKQNVGTKIDSLDKKIDEKINETNEKIDRNQAILARTHILRFADDLRNGIHHSEEYFRQQMLDCDTYEKYCLANPDFSNGLTIIASDYIKTEFKKQYMKGEDT